MATEYLTEQWFAAANDAVSALEPSATGVTIGYRIVNTNDGAAASIVEYHLRLGPQRVELKRGSAGSRIVMEVDHQLAHAIAKGEANAQRAFLDGKIALEGDANLLLGHSEILTQIDSLLSQI